MLFDELLESFSTKQTVQDALENLQASLEHYVNVTGKPFELGMVDAATEGLFSSFFSMHLPFQGILKGTVVISALSSCMQLTGLKAKTVLENGLVSEIVAESLANLAQRMFQASLSIGIVGYPKRFGKQFATSKSGLFLAFKQHKALKYKIKYIPISSVDRQDGVLSVLMCLREFIEKDTGQWKNKETI